MNLFFGKTILGGSCTTMAVEKARIRATQQFSINENKLYRRGLNSEEETR